MIGIIYSEEDPASRNIKEHLIKKYGFEKEGGHYAKGNIAIHKIEGRLVEAQSVESLGLELACFVSRHRSSAGIASFTIHSTGNWGTKAEFGGKPKSLSMAAPIAMLEMLRNILNIDATGMEKTYEATHHGPLLDTPSFFAELGGNEDTINSKWHAALLADAVYNSLLNISEKKVECKKVVIGIGCTHYPEKFCRLASEKAYAFSHIMPKYALSNEDNSSNIDMVRIALNRSADKMDCAVLEKKGLNTQQRKEIIGELDAVGIEHEMV